MMILFVVFCLYSEKKYTNYDIITKPPNIPKDYTIELKNFTPDKINKLKAFLETLSKPEPPINNYNYDETLNLF